MQGLEDKTDNKKQNNIIPFIPDGDFYFTKGVEAFQKHKFEIAMKWMKKAIETSPKNPLFQCQLSIIYTEIGAYHKANQILTDVLQTTGDKYADCYYLLANNYAHLGLLNDAKKYAESYLTIEPNGDFHEEAKTLLQLIDVDDENDEWELDEEDDLLLFQETVFYHLEHKEYEKALPILEEMMALFPEHQSIEHDYTRALFYTGNETEAIQMELDVLDAKPDELYSHMNLANFYYEQNEKEAFERHIQVLLNVYPIHEQQKLRVAITLAKTGYYQNAYQRFRMLQNNMVTNHLSYYRWYSHTCFHLGMEDKAKQLWGEGCKRHPNLSKEVRPWM
ncbi:tetratricopeptide repeat protein [Oceanobacillus halotolerans]|uniref:tetratricopeptide repeat protein n=1 Tax=Oceanobacillus halotolerans TaxID=2663380 RepID=UPI0013DC9138|nr:hypothetical protein [Oceanobacillus halotolerans]